MARFVLAVSPYGPAAVDEDATRHRCVAWNQGCRRLADLVVDHLQAGAIVCVEGRLQRPPQSCGQNGGANHRALELDAAQQLALDAQFLSGEVEEPLSRLLQPLKVRVQVGVRV